MDELHIILDTCKLDILAITETHLKSSINNQSISINGYRLIRRDRVGRGGGGCALYIANKLKSFHLQCLDSALIENIWIKVITESCSIAVGLYYRPPGETEFFDGLEKSLEKSLRNHWRNHWKSLESHANLTDMQK